MVKRKKKITVDSSSRLGTSGMSSARSSRLHRAVSRAEEKEKPAGRRELRGETEEEDLDSIGEALELVRRLLAAVVARQHLEGLRRVAIEEALELTDGLLAGVVAHQTARLVEGPLGARHDGRLREVVVLGREVRFYT